MLLLLQVDAKKARALDKVNQIYYANYKISNVFKGNLDVAVVTGRCEDDTCNGYRESERETDCEKGERDSNCTSPVWGKVGCNSLTELDTMFSIH